MPSNKFAWTWKIKPDRLDEYVTMHLSPWPEIMLGAPFKFDKDNIDEWKQVY